MQLASHGLRALKGTQANSIPSSRSIHIPASVPHLPSGQATSSVQTTFRHARTLISRFVAHLTTPGTLRTSVNVSSGVRPFHVSAARMPTIQQRLSFPARHILSKPLAVPFLPRPPAVPRHISQVGLGVARSFSTGRPIFQHLIENVPVYARAFNEADWEIRIEEERERLRMERYKAKKAAKAMKKANAPLKPLHQNIPVAASGSKVTEESTAEELNHYFPAAAVPEVTTHLLIPLAPTPTSRFPLPLNPPATTSAHPLLPLNVISSLHDTHGTHALRVSTLFARLDIARVFDDPSVLCEARGDPSGLCTVLEVRFEGWTAHKVRGVLGEAGAGWCVLDEVWRDQEKVEAEEMDAALETLSMSETGPSRTMSVSGLSDLNASWGASSEGIDPARSFVLPTLDFSASFGSPSYPSRPPSPIQTPLSDLEFHNAWSQIDRRSDSPCSFAADADWEVESMGSDWSELASRPSSAGDQRFGFSSHFTERMGGFEGPREELF